MFGIGRNAFLFALLLGTFGLVLLPLVAMAGMGASTSDLELVQSLSKGLSVTPDQAAGGAGSILNFAKGKLSPADFGKVAGAIPGIDQILKSAPAADSSGAAEMLSKISPDTAGIASLAGAFQKLGLKPEMISKFVPQILGFVKGKGGQATADLLGNVLK